MKNINSVLLVGEINGIIQNEDTTVVILRTVDEKDGSEMFHSIRCNVPGPWSLLKKGQKAAFRGKLNAHKIGLFVEATEFTILHG